MRRIAIAVAITQLTTLLWPLLGAVAYITTRRTLASQRHAITAAITAELEHA